MILIGGQVWTDDGSDYRWVSAESNPLAAKAAAPGAKAGSKADVADGEVPAETPKAPAGQWRSPVRKPAGGQASGRDAAIGKTPAGPKRLPEDPGYKPPKPKAVPGPAAVPKDGSKAPRPGGAAKAASPSSLAPTLSPTDRSPCDWCGDCHCQGTCGTALRARACDAGKDEDEDEGFKLLNLPFLTDRGVDVRGWLDQGFTWNPAEPGNRFNGPVTFNDRSNEYQMNQLYLIAERVTKTEDKDWDLGGRVDVLYGTDARFTTATGLETAWNEGERFYGLAMPQMYGDLAYKKWVFRFGHFYTIHGNEVVAAPDNFFYSHSYGMQYGEPFTHTGGLAKYQWNERISFTAAIVEGWDNWTDSNKKASFIGGVNWTSKSERTSLAWALISGNEQAPGIESTRTLSTVVFTQKVGEKWKYIFQNDYGFETNVAGTDAKWYSFINDATYEPNDKWGFGAKYEWLPDEEGARVSGIGVRDGWQRGITLTATPARWQEATVGLNYKHNKNVLLRSELRWDWVTPLGGTPWVEGYGPFDNYTQRHQFLWDIDLIAKF